MEHVWFKMDRNATEKTFIVLQVFATRTNSTGTPHVSHYTKDKAVCLRVSARMEPPAVTVYAVAFNFKSAKLV